MTKDDALRMMLGPFKAWRDVPGNEDVVEELTKIINAVEKVLAQPEQEPTAKYSDIVSDGGLDPRNKFDAPPQRTEQNFCSRCGKRTKDLITIHTCTPPKD
jgi:hypothetical protein